MPPKVSGTFSCATHESEPSHSDVQTDHEVWRQYESFVRQTWWPTPSFLICIHQLVSCGPHRSGNTSQCQSRKFLAVSETNTGGHGVEAPTDTFRTLQASQRLFLPQGVQPSTRDTNETRSDQVLHVSNTCTQNQSHEPTTVSWSGYEKQCGVVIPHVQLPIDIAHI